MATTPPAPTSDRARRKIEKVLDEFDAGTLKSSSGQTVRSREQALAIAMSEGRRSDREGQRRRRRL